MTNKEKIHKKNKSRRAFTYLILILIIVTAYLIYSYNIFHIKDRLASMFDPDKYETETSTRLSGNTNKDINENLVVPVTLSKDSKVIPHEHLILSYNEKHEQADWVAYVLEKKEIYGKLKRNNDLFTEDPAVKTKSASTEDYIGSGYDRGHLAMAAHFKFDQTALQESFYMSNISPQKHNFNSGIWNVLEKKMFRWAKRKKALYVVVGPILTPDLPKIGRRNKISVPKYFYKVIADFRKGKESMIAFLIPARDSAKPLKDFVISVDALEEKTGIDFYPELDDALEEELEAKIDIKNWF